MRFIPDLTTPLAEPLAFLSSEDTQEGDHSENMSMMIDHDEMNEEDSSEMNATPQACFSINIDELNQCCDRGPARCAPETLYQRALLAHLPNAPMAACVYPSQF